MDISPPDHDGDYLVAFSKGMEFYILRPGDEDLAFSSIRRSNQYSIVDLRNDDEDPYLEQFGFDTFDAALAFLSFNRTRR